MEIYLSPVYVIILGLFIIGIFSTLRLPSAVIASIAIVMVVYTLYLHVYMYSTEYSVISTSAWVENLAPTLLITTVVLMSVAYIIYFYVGNKSLGKPESNTKSSSSSFNPLSYFNSTKKSVEKERNNSTKTNLTQSEKRDYISDLDRLI